jgi:hypothetical protein
MDDPSPCDCGDSQLPYMDDPSPCDCGDSHTLDYTLPWPLLGHLCRPKLGCQNSRDAAGLVSSTWDPKASVAL